MKAKISILTPTYNHEKYISSCIESVISQSFSNWEMIIIDDCSRDQTYKIAKKYEKLDKRIKIVRHRKRWGIKHLKNSYNEALNLSKGELIAIIEGDDRWPKNKLEMQLKDFINNNIVLSFGDAVIINQNQIPCLIYSYRDRVNKYLNAVGDEKLVYFLNIVCNIIPVSVMIRRSMLIKIKGFKDNELYPFVDIPTWFEIISKGAAVYKNSIYGFYRKHSDSAWFKFVNKSQSMGESESLQIFSPLLKDTGRYSSNVKKQLGLQVERKKKAKKIRIAAHRFIFGHVSQYFTYVFYLLSIIYYGLISREGLKTIAMNVRKW